ncbi:MAG: AAA family ATPase [Rhodanobacteraceae bacterium]|nr:AAA family ATPase [Rhodanobacteraceae bacterium]
MLTYLRVDNLRSLVNFEWRPGTVNLLVGSNGSGKTTVLSALNLVCQLMRGQRVTECLTASDLTWWQRRDRQQISLRVKRETQSAFVYDLTIKYEGRLEHPLIEREALSEDGRLLFEYTNNTVTLYDDEFRVTQKFSLSGSRSFIPEVPASGNNTKLCWFRDYWFRALILKPDIFRFSSHTTDEESVLRQDATNFASWWREMALSRPSAIHRLDERLPAIVSGATSLRLADRHSGRALSIDIHRHGKVHTTGFDQLTEGQRTLILLYAISECLDRASLIALDEALNYIAIAEIQPALVALREAVVDAGGQLIVVSHHPEVIDYLGADDTFVFSLKNGLSECVPLRDIDLSGARLSEYLAGLGDAV